MSTSMSMTWRVSTVRRTVPLCFAEHSQTADLVRAALDDLRARLDADGVRSGQLTVDAQGAGTSGRDQQAPAPERLDDATTEASGPTVTAAPATTSDSLLDVRI